MKSGNHSTCIHVYTHLAMTFTMCTQMYKREINTCNLHNATLLLSKTICLALNCLKKFSLEYVVGRVKGNGHTLTACGSNRK